MKKEYKIAVAGTGYVGLSIATLVYHSFRPPLYVLFLITFTNTSTERLGLIRKFIRGKRKLKVHWVNGVGEEWGEKK